MTSCGDLPQPALAGQISGTPTPTATADPSGYQAVAPQSCMVSQWNTLQSERRQGQTMTWMQGDLIAWQPGSSNLAYLAPGERSSWFTGELMLARGPQFQERIQLAQTILATGDLTWSPSGDWLAFLAYRPNESLYTVMIVASDGSGLTDLFPTDLARTDTRTSQKAIIGWQNNQTLRVIASCGETCRLAYDLDVTQPAGPVLLSTPVENHQVLAQNLQINRRAITVTPAAFPKIISTPQISNPHWSPDERQISYIDRRGILWLLSIDDKINYPLDIGLRDVYETQWSQSSNRLAVRAEDRVFVFEIPCQSK